RSCSWALLRRVRRAARTRYVASIGRPIPQSSWLTASKVLVVACRQQAISVRRYECGQLPAGGRKRWGGRGMREAGKGTPGRCLDLARATRRDILTMASAVGAGLASDAIPALAQAASERPKENDVLVSIERDTTDALAPADLPLGGPLMLAWPM